MKKILYHWELEDDLSYQESKDLAKKIEEEYSSSEKLKIVLSPQFPLLFPLKEILKNSKIALACQNSADEIHGAYTGEVSPALLGEVCNYCILGHSERRNIFKNPLKE